MLKALGERLRALLAGYPFLTSSLFLILAVSITAIVIHFAGYELTFPLRFEDFNKQYPYLLLTMFFGASVGAAEIASRYRDEPFLSIISPPGRTYLAFNALVALAAFCLLARYPKMFGLGDDFVLMSVVAGFGAMVVMRSKLFNFKTNAGESFSVGPDAVVNTFLTSVDRNVDRYRSFDRQAMVFQEVIKIRTPAEAPVFFETFLASYQNLSDADKSGIREQIQDVLARQDLSDELKLMAISFGFLNISGDANFRAMMALLGRFQEPPPPA
jgi:hypothetical protein